MKHILAATLALLSPVSRILSPAHAEDRGKLIFEDKFDRNESQETKEEIGNGWTTNSENRAGGRTRSPTSASVLTSTASMKRGFIMAAVQITSRGAIQTAEGR